MPRPALDRGIGSASVYSNCPKTGSAPGFAPADRWPSGSPKKTYGQRWQVETVFSMVKRLLDSALTARSYSSQNREAALRFLTHNLMILKRLLRRIPFQQSRNVPGFPELANRSGLRLRPPVTAHLADPTNDHFSLKTTQHNATRGYLAVIERKHHGMILRIFGCHIGSKPREYIL
jgi:hypothetical protein